MEDNQQLYEAYLVLTQAIASLKQNGNKKRKETDSPRTEPSRKVKKQRIHGDISGETNVKSFFAIMASGCKLTKKVPQKLQVPGKGERRDALEAKLKVRYPQYAYETLTNKFRELKNDTRYSNLWDKVFRKELRRRNRNHDLVRSSGRRTVNLNNPPQAASGRSTTTTTSTRVSQAASDARKTNNQQPSSTAQKIPAKPRSTNTQQPANGTKKNSTQQNRSTTPFPAKPTMTGNGNQHDNNSSKSPSAPSSPSKKMSAQLERDLYSLHARIIQRRPQSTNQRKAQYAFCYKLRESIESGNVTEQEAQQLKHQAYKFDKYLLSGASQQQQQQK